MKVTLVSSWRPRWCGIAIYSADLVHALEKLGVKVEVICHTDGANEPNVHPVLDMRKPNWPDVLAAEIQTLDPDLVHIQHEYGIYTLIQNGQFDFSPANSFRLAEALFKLEIGFVPTAVTYHSVFSSMTYEEVSYLKHFADLTTATIVHEPFQKKALVKYLGSQISNKIFDIAHGAWSGSNFDKEKCKINHGWQDKLVVGMIGFIEKTKGFEKIIEIWPEVVKKIPNALLVIEGAARPGSPSGEASLASIEAAIEKTPAKDSIQLVKKLFSWPENNDFISGFDLLVLPYNQASQSGNLAHGYGAGLPIVAADLEGVGASLRASRAGLLAKNNSDYAKAIINLLSSPQKRTNLSESSLAYGKKIDWEIIAKKHLAVYKWAIEANNRNKQNIKKYLPGRTHV